MASQTNTGRFIFKPAPIEMVKEAQPNEFMVDRSSGHVYLINDDGAPISKTLSLEKRMDKLAYTYKFNIPKDERWYRISSVKVDKNNSFCLFKVTSDNKEYDSKGFSLLFSVSMQYNNKPIVNILSYSTLDDINTISKIRIVAPDSITDNYAYLEIFKKGNQEVNISLELIANDNWELQPFIRYSDFDPSDWKDTTVECVTGISSSGDVYAETINTKSHINIDGAKLSVDKETNKLKLTIDGEDVSIGDIKINSEGDGYISVDGEDIKIYEHPTKHKADMIEQDDNHMMVTKEQIKRWDSSTGSAQPLEISTSLIPIKNPTNEVDISALNLTNNDNLMIFYKNILLENINWGISNDCMSLKTKFDLESDIVIWVFKNTAHRMYQVMLTSDDGGINPPEGYDYQTDKIMMFDNGLLLHEGTNYTYDISTNRFILHYEFKSSGSISFVLFKNTI